ncbi:MAG: PrsW family intramembrane metalloprotease [Verrucomicrobiales bacterium]|jgi:RsiW-degrading membrane proteinase PrsW (M82 family)|nr:PrsW family intramembrane metalloprotease [Verrucomicrobiales bacterium]MBP9222883.1 PrsW family intramembrane metalloprotease [Verrucomicrobiales bacterium]
MNKHRIVDLLWGGLVLASAYFFSREMGGKTTTLLSGYLLSMAVVSPVFLALWWLDRLPPLSARVWLRSLGFGLFVVPVVASMSHLVVEYLVGEQVNDSVLFEPGSGATFGDLAGSLLSAPLVEESLKGLLPFTYLCLSVSSRGLEPRHAGPWPAILIGLVVTLGFGSAENTTHFVGDAAAWQTRISYSYLHAFFSIPVLLAIGFSALLPTLTGRLALSGFGWFVSIIFHAAWNFEVRFDHPAWSPFPWVRHSSLVAPLAVFLCIFLVYWFERRTFNRIGVGPASLGQPPRRALPQLLAETRREFLSSPLIESPVGNPTLAPSQARPRSIA